MNAWKLAAIGVSMSLGLVACGKVSATTDGAVAGGDGGGSTGDGGAGARDAAGSGDAPAPDAMTCTGNMACDNGAFCDGPEVCQENGECAAGTAPDCGTSDVCFNRSCDEDKDKCAETALSYSISYNYTAGSSGTVMLTCSGSKTTQTLGQQCPTGAPFQLKLNCAIDDTGMLAAVVTSSAPSCLAGGKGPSVTSGCSVYGTNETFSCCWP